MSTSSTRPERAEREPAPELVDPRAEGDSSLELVYVGDPMCSWCWGFEPELTAVRRWLAAEHKIAATLRVGGLRTGRDVPPWSELRDFLQATWQRIGALTDQPFDAAFLERADFHYDTEPACRAVVLAREASPAAAFELFGAIQRAFYADGCDVTDLELLTEIASASGFEAGSFRKALGRPGLEAATRAEFQACRDLGVAGFPTLLLRRGTEFEVVSRGFARAPALLASLAARL